jgi:hypothetical protein
MFKNLQFFGILLTLLAGIPGVNTNTTEKLKTVDNGISAVSHGETFIRAKVSVGSIHPLVDVQTEYAKGVTNIDKGVVPFAQQINYLKFGYDVQTDTDNKKPQELLYTADVPASFRNATIIIKHRGKEILKQPVSSLVQSSSAYTLEEKWYALDVPLMVNNTDILEVNIEYPEGATGVAGKHEFVELFFKGPKLNA